MFDLVNLIHLLLPLISLLLLICGINSARKSYVLMALWISLVSIVLHYETAGSQILGAYFGYLHSALYTINLILLLTSILYLLNKYKKHIFYRYKRIPINIIEIVACCGFIILLINVWINAYFIESKLPGTPLLQIAVFSDLPYCDYQYVFYKINKQHKLDYLCPNHFGIAPSIGTLGQVPDFIFTQLPIALQQKINK